MSQFLFYVFSTLWSHSYVSYVWHCEKLCNTNQIQYSHLPSYTHQSSISGGTMMVTAQGVEFTDWLGRHEERVINDRRAPYRVSGQ